tara:strand:- start:217 stop:531 length:315 start_codon:yes stop_codon:yes gene_type:complete
MREGANASLKVEQKTLTGGNWQLVLPTNVNRTYLCIQNNTDAHAIEIGFNTDTVAPTTGFHLIGSPAGNATMDSTFEFKVAPINSVWCKSADTHDHLIHVMYDD